MCPVGLSPIGTEHGTPSCGSEQTCSQSSALVGTSQPVRQHISRHHFGWGSAPWSSSQLASVLATDAELTAESKKLSAEIAKKQNAASAATDAELATEKKDFA